MSKFIELHLNPPIIVNADRIVYKGEDPRNGESYVRS